jgi:hypothetical protein
MRRLILAVCLALACGTASGQSPAPTLRVRGTITSVSDEKLAVRTREGADVTLAIDPGLTVSGLVARTMADVKAGDFVGSTSTRGADGRLYALELHFLPPTASEGQRPFDLVPDSLMTNAYVQGVAEAHDGATLKVAYKGEVAEVVVPPNTPIVAYVPGNRSLLVPGAAIVVFAANGPGGGMTAVRATVEKDGVKPPM